ncbi:hypothetical protein EV06_1243 [Prochlorococcus sp. MIT 0602]|nr:hypothetical protein EV06_1243 [Prochlorococcus sp. MIT 0602]KGG17650.1 hypothetical protein EV07_1090 [Prochlorococcus sp. MIT 0603]
MGSSAGNKPSIVVSPSAIAPNNRERCDIDLSPGTFTLPIRLPPDLISRIEDWHLFRLKVLSLFLFFKSY